MWILFKLPAHRQLSFPPLTRFLLSSSSHLFSSLCTYSAWWALPDLIVMPWRRVVRALLNFPSSMGSLSQLLIQLRLERRRGRRIERHRYNNRWLILFAFKGTRRRYWIMLKRERALRKVLNRVVTGKRLLRLPDNLHRLLARAEIHRR